MWGFYLYNKPHKNVSSLKVSVSLTSKELCEQYQKDEAAADKIFLDKVIEVKGTVADIQHTDSTASVQLEGCASSGNINCSFVFNKEDQIQLPLKNSIINIKGRCTGFLADVNLVDCVFEQ